MDGLVKTLGILLLLLGLALWVAVIFLVPAALVKFCWLYRSCNDSKRTADCKEQALRQDTEQKNLPAMQGLPAGQTPGTWNDLPG